MQRTARKNPQCINGHSSWRTRRSGSDTKELDEKSTAGKILQWTSPGMEQIGSSIWGLAVQAKEVSDLFNRQVMMRNMVQAVKDAENSNDYLGTLANSFVKGQQREVVEALGFDPTKITHQQYDDAFAMTNVIIDAPSMYGVLKKLVKDYAEAQHGIEIMQVVISGVFEVVIAMIIASMTAGSGVVASVSTKTHLVKKFQKVGDLLSDFAKKRATELWSEEQARQAHTKNEAYTVLVGNTERPTAVIDIAPSTNFVGVTFLDDLQREYLSYNFKILEPNQLFLSMATHREFTKDSDKVDSGSSYIFNLDGKLAIMKQSINPINLEEFESTIDISGNYEIFSNFDEYDHLLKIER
jgi:hypothetical protein